MICKKKLIAKDSIYDRGTHSPSSFPSLKTVHSNKLFLSDSDSTRVSRHTSSFLPTDGELILLFQGQDASEAGP